jgi:hypothetical protein
VAVCDIALHGRVDASNGDRFVWQSVAGEEISSRKQRECRKGVS